jgi:hypothetical protein
VAVSILRKLFTHRSPSPGAGSGRGGTLGTPAMTLDEAGPSQDQEDNAVVSGGGLVGSRDDADPSSAAEKSPSAQAH